MAMKRNVVSFFAVAALLVTVANAATHIVGNTEGWTIGVDYEAWASKYSIEVGDTLGFHDVLQVSEEDYDSCTTTSPIDSDDSGITKFGPLREGKWFFICGTPVDCELGMKLAVTTSGYSGSDNSPPPPASKTRSPPSETSQPPPASTSRPPPTSTSWQLNSAHRFNSAGSFALIFALTMLAAI